MNRSRQLISRRAGWLLCLAALLAPGCGGSNDTPEKPSGTAPESTPGYPSSMAVLGHSGATGEGSDPDRPGEEVRANSWATGTNPAVKSLYLRILAKNPSIKGHNINLAEAGATVDQLVFQAEEAVSGKPKPDLFVIQIMDNDIVCPASASDLREFRSTLVSAFEELVKGAPEADIFVISQFGSPGTNAKALPLELRVASGGTGPCDFLDLEGRLVPKKLVRAERAIHGYEAQLEAGCRRFDQCRYDGGAFGRVVDQSRYISSDGNHLSVQGHAKAAAVAWAGITRADIVP
jgi:hypothetical protein